METIKIKQTETYKDSEGEHIVCKGKLVLVQTDKLPVIGELCWNKEIKSPYIFDFIDNIAQSQYNSKVIKPIIISETEEIEVGDNIYHKLDGRVIIFTKEIYHKCSNDPKQYGYKKVLTLPENFSPKHLQSIADGKLKDSDEVCIECEKYPADIKGNEILIASTYINAEYGRELPNDAIDVVKALDLRKIKLTNNHIKLFTINKEEKKYTRSEVFQILNNAIIFDVHYKVTREELKEWFNKNYPE